jgi:hypothetical protein
MRILAALVLLAHGVAHVPSFLGRWRLTPLVPYETTILGGRMNVGGVGARIVGLLWLLLAIDFGLLAWGAYAGAAWWSYEALATAVVSLLFCVSAWPGTSIGVFVNVALIIVIAVWRAGLGLIRLG